MAELKQWKTVGHAGPFVGHTRRIRVRPESRRTTAGLMRTKAVVNGVLLAIIAAHWAAMVLWWPTLRLRLAWRATALRCHEIGCQPKREIHSITTCSAGALSLTVRQLNLASTVPEFDRDCKRLGLNFKRGIEQRRSKKAIQNKAVHSRFRT